MNNFILLFAFSFSVFSLEAVVLEVGPGKQYSNPTQAANVAQPGDTILLFPNEYHGTFFIIDLNGTADNWITIMGTSSEDVIFVGQTEGLHFTNISYIRIENMSFTGQTGNGMNIDDGGTFETPSHHVIVKDCVFYNMGAQGNNDFLKLSGLDDFEIVNCSFTDGAAGGSGIDMVGCHNGVIQGCSFLRLGSNCIQAKGGTQYIRIQQNYFEDGGQRTLNLGGSTGLAFFRPQDAPFEAADIEVYSNIIIGSWAPIAYVGCVRTNVVNNTIYTPQNWIIRILQESVDVNRFLPCGDNSFVNNIIYYTNSLSRHVNIGPNTAPETFNFSNNLWYNQSNPAASVPVLPVAETNQIAGEDPLFIDPNFGDFALQAGSPAIGTGLQNAGPLFDFFNNLFNSDPSRGAIEGDEPNSTFTQIDKIFDLDVYPNPSNSIVQIRAKDLQKIVLLDSYGRLITSVTLNQDNASLNMSGFQSGIYYLRVFSNEGLSKTVKVVRVP
jgi:hypothetical protein